MKTFKKIFTVLSLALMITLVIPSLVPLAQNTVQASTIKINKKEATLRVKDTQTLKISGTSKKVTWSTSKKSVATVSSKGKVTAKKKGTATITATVNKKKYTCKVTVTDGTLTDKEMAVYGWVLLQDKLKNPDSLKIHSIKVGTEDITYGDGTTFTDVRTVIIDYSAQNGFGGYNRGYAGIRLHPRDEAPTNDYLTSTNFDGYLMFAIKADGYTPALENQSTFKAKDIQPLVTAIQEEENYEIY